MFLRCSGLKLICPFKSSYSMFISQHSAYLLSFYKYSWPSQKLESSSGAYILFFFSPWHQILSNCNTPESVHPIFVPLKGKLSQHPLPESLQWTLTGLPPSLTTSFIQFSCVLIRVFIFLYSPLSDGNILWPCVDWGPSRIPRAFHDLVHNFAMSFPDFSLVT